MIDTIFSFFRRYSILFVILFIVISAGYIAFKEFWWFGSVRVYPSVSPIVIQIEDEGEFSCSASSCDFRFPPGEYQASAEKNEYEKIFFSFHISQGEIIEKNLVFSKKKLQVQKISKHSFPPLLSKKIFLPLKNNAIGDKISGYSFEEKNLFWKKNFLFSSSVPTYISSDEVGRGVFFISENGIKKFNRKTQNLSTILKKKILAFETFSSGQSVYMDEKKQYFLLDTTGISYPIENFSPLSFRSFCLSEKNTLLSLEYKNSNLVFEQYSIEADYIKNSHTSVAEVENFFVPDGVEIFCPSSSRVLLSVQNTDDIFIVAY